MSTLPESAQTNVRHPLGLPPGSVRGILALGITGLFCFHLLQPGDHDGRVPLYLHALLPMILVYFAVLGKSHSQAGAMFPAPLWLPRGTIRLLVLVGLIAPVAFLLYSDPQTLRHRMVPAAEELKHWPETLSALLGGFLLGYVARLGPWRNRPAFQDVIAWVSLLALVLFVVEVLIEVIIQPGLTKRLDPVTLRAILTAIVAFYFGVRS